MTDRADEPLRDATGVGPRNHARDAGMARLLPPADCAASAAAHLTRREAQILRLLAECDSRPAPDFERRPRVPACVSRARLRASPSMMETLHVSGLVNGAGSRDAGGVGTTAATSWYWLTSFGLLVAREVGGDVAGGCWESAAEDWRGVSRAPRVAP